MRKRSFSMAFLFFAFSAAVATAQTTGEIVGRVTDEQGGALPGVAIEARSTALQGARTTVTDAAGAYRLVLLPPGAYRVTATIQGFARVEQTAPVALAKTATLDFRLTAAVQEAVVVSGQAPVVDTTSTTAGANFDEQEIRTLPTGRNYAAIVQVSPGVSTQVSNTQSFANSIAVYGSSGLENGFIIDGVNTTGVEYGAQGKELNYEFIQEIDVKTGGYQAEFGRSTGGIVNVITKSGGNEFHGDVFGYYDADSLQAENKHPDENLYGTSLGFTRYDVGVDLGGYFVRDKLWFFGAYDFVKNTQTNTLTSGPEEGLDVESKSERNLASAKLTWNITPSNTFVGSFFQDPRDDSGAINDGAHTLNGELSTFLGVQEFGGQDYAGRYSGIFGADWVAGLNFSLHQERNNVAPSTPPGEGIQYIDQAQDDLQIGGFGLVQAKEFKRWFYGGSLTRFLSNHELKLGAEYEHQTALVTKEMSGGQQVRIIPNPGNASLPVYRHFYWSVPGASVPDNVPISQLNATPKHNNLTLYLQDSWRVLPNLTLNLGVRWDNQKIYDSNGTRQINLDQDFAPRVGIVWDPSKDHRTKVYGSFGYFYEQIPMDLVIRSFSFEQQAVIYNFDPVALNLDESAAIIADDEGAIDQGGGKVLGGFTEPSDPNMGGQYMREFLVGFEQELFPNLAVGARYLYRNLGRVVEDFLCSDTGTYCIGNPSLGEPGLSPGGEFPGFQQIFALNYVDQFPAPRPVRIYRGVQVDVAKRFSDNWSLLASYLWSKMDGNYDGNFAPYTQPRGTADPNISAAYDYYDFFTPGSIPEGGPALPYTASGPLHNDRRSQFKLSGVYVTPFQLAVGLVGYYRTGTPVSRLGFSVAYDRSEFFLLPRGTDGRVPADYEIDLHLGYPLAIGPVTVNFLVDFFQLLNAQRATFLDEAYNNGEFEDPAHVCGTGGPDDEQCNPFYKTALSRTQPRAVRFGLRVAF
jgi:outer membrane receptor for ferrienterochelin and colicin